jgi:hypothetical protein
MASSVVFKLTCLALVCTVVIAAKAQRVVPCNEIVVNSLRPCVIDIAYGDQFVSDTCCGGILSLRQLAKTKMESRSIFTFLKKFLHGFPYTDDHVRLGASLPEKCGVILPYVISPTMDCNMYDWLSLQIFFFFSYAQDFVCPDHTNI